MDNASRIVRYFCFFIGLSSLVYCCDTNPEFEDNGITLSWTVCGFSRKEVFYLRTCEGIGGVEVCVSGQPQIRCGHTTNDGEFILQNVPRHDEVLLTFTHPNSDYQKLLVPVRTGNHDINWRVSARNSSLPEEIWYPPMTKAGPCDEKQDTGQIAAVALEFVFDPDTLPLPDNELLFKKIPDAGEVSSQESSNECGKELRALRLMARPVLGMKASLENSAVKPIYTDACGKENKKEDSDAIKDGYALFCGLPEKDYNVIFELDKDDMDRYYCVLADVMADRPIWGFRTKKPYMVRVPVRAGATTITAIKCYNTEKGQPSNLFCEQYEDASSD